MKHCTFMFWFNTVLLLGSSTLALNGVDLLTISAALLVNVNIWFAVSIILEEKTK